MSKHKNKSNYCYKIRALDRNEIEKEDFIYFDPPYIPLTQTEQKEGKLKRLLLQTID